MLKTPATKRSNYYYNEASQMACAYLNMPSYNAGKDQVSQNEWTNGKRWYDNLSGEEIAARCIFGENFHKDAYNDRLAVLCVIGNRIAQSKTSASAVLTQKNAFTTINPGSYSQNACQHARAAKNPSDPVWKEATILGCLLSLITSTTGLCEAVGGWPAGISTQTNFLGLDSIYKDLKVDNGYLYYGNRCLKDAAIAGEGRLNITASSTKSSLLYAYYGNNRYNLFYTW